MSLNKIVFLACVLVVHAEPLTNEARQAMYNNLLDICKAQEGASDADVQEINSHQVPSTHTGQCFNACVMEKAGILKLGKLSVGGCMKIAEMTGDPLRVKNVQIVSIECESIVGADRCDAALQILRCVNKSAATHGFDPSKDLL